MKPNLHGDEYINRKGKATLNVQATCDAKEMFKSVDVGWPGSVHDSRIWKNSQVCLKLRMHCNAVVLGDDEYGIEPWLMTPFQTPRIPAEVKYNQVFKRERVIIERCFRQLKRQFPFLQYVCRVKLENVPKVITTCFILHNIAKSLSDPNFASDDEIPEIDDENYDNNPAEGDFRQQGQEIRRNIIVILHNR